MEPGSILQNLSAFSDQQKKDKAKGKPVLMGILIVGLTILIVGLALILSGNLGGIAAVFIGGILSLAVGISTTQLKEMNYLILMAEQCLSIMPDIENHIQQTDHSHKSNTASLLADDYRMIQSIINKYEIKNPAMMKEKQKFIEIIEAPIKHAMAKVQSNIVSEQKVISGIEKVKRLLAISDEIKLDDLQQFLHIGRGELLDLLLNIEDTTLFSITGDHLKVNSKQSTGLFIDQLDNQFKQWEGNEDTKAGKK